MKLKLNASIAISQEPNELFGWTNIFTSFPSIFFFCCQQIYNQLRKYTNLDIFKNRDYRSTNYPVGLEKK